MTENQERYKRKCLKLIEEKLGWGESADWSNADFQKLSNLIYEETKAMLSASTLKRIWGKVNHAGNPAISTLDVLTAFIGYENWRAFVVKENELAEPKQGLIAPTPKTKRKSSLVWSIGLAVLLILIFSFFHNFKTDGIERAAPLASGDFSFSSKPLAEGIPNSVIFTYDASPTPTDSTVFIQQSWDASRRKQVSKDQHQFTAIYYEPGFYTAKLSVGQQVVKEHPLLIPSDGWLGTIAHAPIPIYLKKEDFLQEDRLELPVSTIENNKASHLSQTPVVKYFNVGGFDAVAVSDFTFKAQLKNNYHEGNGACQFSQVLLITDSAPILLPLSIKGCVSELGLMSVDQMISGKTTDLSKFGVDFSNWVKIACKGDEKSIYYYVNDQLAYEAPLSSKEAKIVGMVFVFAGTGAVKDIRLENAKGMVYREF